MRAALTHAAAALLAMLSVAVPPSAAVAQTKPPGDPKAEARVLLRNLPTDLFPEASNSWNCSCDTDGCWPGCFTIAAATVAKYWSHNGFANLWNNKANATLSRMRELFPNLQCTGNGNANGRPGDTVFDAVDVAVGFAQFIRERGYAFTITPVFKPTFENIKSEIDAGRPIIGVFGVSPWGSHAATILGYDTKNGRQVFIVRPNLSGKPDTELEWNVGYSEFGLVTIVPGLNRGSYPVAPKVTFEVMVDDRDPGFAEFGEWKSEAGFGLGGSSRWRTSTDPTNLGPTDDTSWVKWSPKLPYDGLWEVMAWMPTTDAKDEFARNSTYRVLHAEGMSLARRSQHDAVEGWMSLGTYPFAAGDKGGVRLGDFSGDNQPRKIWADAMRFVWRAPLVVRHEDDPTKTFLVVDGRRRLIPADASRASDPKTFDALRLTSADVRKLTAMQLSQYPETDPLPSIYGAWIGQYFNNLVLSPPTSLVRGDPRIEFNWTEQAPAPGMSKLGFSSRWTRVLAMPEGRVPLNVNAVGGVRLWVDGKLEIDAWNASDDITRTLIAHQRVISVTGDLHVLEVEYNSRDGASQIVFGNLPPFVPIVTAAVTPTAWTNALTATLSWLDAGDPDSPGAPRRFFVTLWRDGAPDSINSGWISETTWTVDVPSEGKWLWRVSASDGTSVSEWSQTNHVWIDRAPPWAQMLTAANDFSAREAITHTPDLQQPDAQPAPPTNTQEISQVAFAGAKPLRSQGIQLTWWATDTVSGAATFDAQFREIIRAVTQYSPTVELREVKRSAQEVVVQNGNEITRATTITELVPTLTYDAIRSFEPVATSEWITFAVGLVATSTNFVGTPGSTYEFRVRAIDRAGNVQAWHEGYAAREQMDINADFNKVFIPVLSR